MNRPVVNLPCNGCTLCCQSDDIFIHRECGDVAGAYETVLLADGRRRLRHQPNGDCIYLEARGCSIHDRRPVVCGEMDCRIFLRHPEQRSTFSGKHWRAMLKAARRLDRRMAKVAAGVG